MKDLWKLWEPNKDLAGPPKYPNYYMAPDFFETDNLCPKSYKYLKGP